MEEEEEEGEKGKKRPETSILAQMFRILERDLRKLAGQADDLSDLWSETGR